MAIKSLNKLTLAKDIKPKVKSVAAVIVDSETGDPLMIFEDPDDEAVDISSDGKIEYKYEKIPWRTSRQGPIRPDPSIDETRIESLSVLRSRLHVIQACLEKTPTFLQPAELLLEGAISLLLDFDEEIQYEMDNFIGVESLGNIVKEDDRHSDALGNVVMNTIPLRKPWTKFHAPSVSPHILSIVGILQQLLTTHRVDQVRASAFRGTYDRKNRTDDDESSIATTDSKIEMMEDDGRVVKQVRSFAKQARKDFVEWTKFSIARFWSTWFACQSIDQWKRDDNGCLSFQGEDLDSGIRVEIHLDSEVLRTLKVDWFLYPLHMSALELLTFPEVESPCKTE